MYLGSETDAANEKDGSSKGPARGSIVDPIEIDFAEKSGIEEIL